MFDLPPSLLDLLSSLLGWAALLVMGLAFGSMDEYPTGQCQKGSRCSVFLAFAGVLALFSAMLLAGFGELAALVSLPLLLGLIVRMIRRRARRGRKSPFSS
jgi:hypothetical protein